jgi:transposase
MRYELTDYEWTAVRPFLPNKPRGVPRVNDRRVLNGIFWVLRSGAPWRDLPETFGPYTTCYNRFVRWGREFTFPDRRRHGAPIGFKLNSLCTAGKSCSARDLYQLSVCLLVVCLTTTTVGEAYLVGTIGRRSESQSTRPKSVLSGSPRARQCRTACRPSWRWHRAA